MKRSNYAINASLRVIVITAVFVLYAAAGLYGTAVALEKEDHAEITLLCYDDFLRIGVNNKAYLIAMSKYPDEHKLWFEHAVTGKRAKDSFVGALNNCSPAQRPAAAANLVKAFHYIQDRGDPSKELDTAWRRLGGKETRKRVVRGILHQLLIRGEIRFRQPYSGRYRQKVGEMTSNMRGFTFDQQMKYIHDVTVKRHNDLLDILKGGGNDEQIKEIMIDSIATMVAIQKRMITHFQNKCGQSGTSGMQSIAAERPQTSGKKCWSRDGRHELCRKNNCNIPEIKKYMCWSRDGRHSMCKKNNCQPQPPCYWENTVIQAHVPCYWQ